MPLAKRKRALFRACGVKERSWDRSSKDRVHRRMAYSLKCKGIEAVPWTDFILSEICQRICSNSLSPSPPCRKEQRSLDVDWRVWSSFQLLEAPLDFCSNPEAPIVQSRFHSWCWCQWKWLGSCPLARSWWPWASSSLRKQITDESWEEILRD